MAWVGWLVGCLANLCKLQDVLVGWCVVWLIFVLVGKLVFFLANVCILWHGLVGWYVVWLIFVHCGMGWLAVVLFG